MAAATEAAPPLEQPAARRPEAVRPGPERPRPAARPQAEETPPPRPGDLVCGNCGIGNDPARKFCRRCGQSLATATIAAEPTVPWYRRVFGSGRKRPVAAGERPKSMRKDGRAGGGIRPGRIISAAFQVLVIAAIIGSVTGYAIIPSWRDTVNGFVRSVAEIFVPAADPVATSGKATGLAIKGHPVRALFDGTTDWWAAPVDGVAPPTIGASFAPPADITKVLFTAGAPGEAFKTVARPRDVTLQLLDAGGAVIASKAYELKDQAEPQAFDVGANDVAAVRITVDSVYLAEKRDAPVAITEIEFFGRRAGATSKP